LGMLKQIAVRVVSRRFRAMSTASFVCDACGERFGSRNNLFRHLKATDKNHGVTTIAQDSPPHKKQCTDTGGDTSEQKSTHARISPPDEGIELVCEDEWYRVISKPQGLATMGPRGVTLLKSDKLLLPDAIKLNLPYKKAVPCHRLDKETGGVMLCSKSKLAERTMMVCFRYKLIHKKYIAIVIGKLEPAEGLITTPLSGKAACTRYAVTSHTRSAQYGWVSTVELWPITGKKHQLRKHMQSVGHSIVGDRNYTQPQLWDRLVHSGIPHMFLWAVEITFPHPKYCCDILADGGGPAAAVALATTAAADAANGSAAADGLEEATAVVNILNGSAVIVGNFSADSVQCGLYDIDEDDDDYVIDTTQAVDANNAQVMQAIARIKTLPDSCRVTATIPEPAYYSTFREIHQQSWDAAQAAAGIVHCNVQQE
jgi:23S rRNA-/tRNA-specific pseudouridylate synthase